MKFNSINPATGKIIKTYTYHTPTEIDQISQQSHDTYLSWSKTPLPTRTTLLHNLSKVLLEKKAELAALATTEMGKKTSDAIAEIEKCALVCSYYADHAPTMLRPKHVKTEAKQSLVRYDPLGVCLAIMPWNFPYWQVFRAAAPAIVAGNTMLLKHASCVPGVAVAIEHIFLEAGAPAGLFQTILIPGPETSRLIKNPYLRKISLTGSETAGISVAALAGSQLIPTVLELGGSDPFIVFPDADIKAAVTAATTSRLLVSGQSCIAAKRFIIHQDIYESFLNLFKESLEKKVMGDPSDPETDLGPLINQDAVQTLHQQVQASLKAGAKLITGGYLPDIAGYYYPSTILSGVTPTMPVYQEETFGPVAAVSSFRTIDEALSLANHPHFGLGSSVWTSDQTIIDRLTRELESGSVFVNAMVKSDPRLPFGGTKKSGYGRELSLEGLHEYTNIKTVWIN